MKQARPGDFVWYDVLTRDADAAVAFYADVIGWRSQGFEIAGATYQILVGADGPVCGTVPLATVPGSAGVPPHWTANVFVDDVDASAGQVERLGGRVLIPPTDYPPVGRMAAIADPQGGSLHIYKPSERVAERDPQQPGAFSWNELATSDHGAAFEFYRGLFGWQKVREVDMGGAGQYLVYGNGTRELGGMYTRPVSPSRPPAWLYYIRVANLEASLAGAEARGAKVTSGPQRVPSGDRVATLTDPEGAAFALQAGA